jgi:hypothetical protein
MGVHGMSMFEGDAGWPAVFCMAGVVGNIEVLSLRCSIPCETSRPRGIVQLECRRWTDRTFVDAAHLPAGRQSWRCAQTVGLT